MDLQQCWTHYLKAEQLLEQGHWPEAHYLYDQVLCHLPTHIQSALDCKDTKPCQFSCLLTGLRDAAVSQSEILNKLGQHDRAFELLNQSYALLQFLSIESADLVKATYHILDKTVKSYYSIWRPFAARSVTHSGCLSSNEYKERTTILHR